MVRYGAHAIWVLLLTLTIQIGGLAWVLALPVRRRWLAFSLIYSALSVTLAFTAPITGRTPISCLTDGPLQVQGYGWCLANRTYVVPELKTALEDIAAEVARQHPGTITLVLDGSFPLFDGFPLLPHLSHDDGEKVDLAFYYTEDGAYAPGKTRSPLGCFAFEDGPTQCTKAWPTMRWDMGVLQPLWPDHPLEPERLRTVMQALVADARIGKIFLEPHLQDALGLSHPKIRFQGCRAARHDDHIHLQL